MCLATEMKTKSESFLSMAFFTNLTMNTRKWTLALALYCRPPLQVSEVDQLRDQEALSPATLHLVKMAGSSDETENFVYGEGGPGLEGEGATRKRPKMKHSKTCGVCGDRALGYNFNAVTCESCKAFFRRNAFKETVSSVFVVF